MNPDPRVCDLSKKHVTTEINRLVCVKRKLSLLQSRPVLPSILDQCCMFCTYTITCFPCSSVCIEIVSIWDASDNSELLSTIYLQNLWYGGRAF